MFLQSALLILIRTRSGNLTHGPSTVDNCLAFVKVPLLVKIWDPCLVDCCSDVSRRIYRICSWRLENPLRDWNYKAHKHTLSPASCIREEFSSWSILLRYDCDVPVIFLTEVVFAFCTSLLDTDDVVAQMGSTALSYALKFLSKPEVDSPFILPALIG